MQFQDPQQHYRTTPGSTLSPQANGGQQFEVDFVVRNVYSKIKSLENKYIDLANFYKEGQKSQNFDESKLPRNVNQTSSANQLETSMIQELYEKKRDLEENIKNLKTAVNQQKADPSLQVGHLKNTKRVLHQSFAEISNQVENAQAQCLKALAQKQNEMFQLATKHKISSAFRNETLGLWYDTKSMLAQTFAEVKQTVIQVQHQSEQQLGLSYVYHPKDQPPPALDHAKLSELNDQLYKYSRKQIKQKKELAKIQQNFQENLVDLKNEHANLMQLIEDLTGQQDESSLTRKRVVDKSVYLSPFQRKLQTYSNPALGQGVLNSQKRSASKGTVSQQKIQPTSSATNFQSKSSRALATEDSGVRSITSKDGNIITKGQLDRLKNGLKVQGLSIMQKMTICEDLFSCIEKMNEEGNGFTKILQDLLQQSNPYNQVDQSDRLQELQQQNEQIYSELRQCNEKYIDLRVENSKLRDQVFALQSKSHSIVSPPEERIVNVYQDAQCRDLLDQLCERVNKFMQSMRQLQKAVNRKDPDVAGPKENFESSKTALQSLVAQVRELLHINQGECRQQYTSAQRLQAPASSSSPLREKRPTVSSSQLNKLPLLLQNVKNLQLEKQKMQELINELKLSHAFDTEQMQLKSKQKSERLQKFAAQCTYFQIKQQAQDQLLFEFRQIILQKDITLTEHLSQREKQIEQKVQEDVARVQPSLRLDPQVTALKEELINQIKVKTQSFEAQIEFLSQQLKAKEEGLNRLKLLFVEKLHELETTFVEISNEVAETEQQNQQQAQQKRVPNQFERSVETVLSKFENDDREKDLEQLAEANAELLEQNTQLKNALQSLGEQKNGPESQVSAQLELVIELQDQIDSQKTQLEKQIAKSKELEQSESALKKEIQTLKYDNKRNQFDLKDAKERFEKAKNEYQAQFNGLKMTILSQKQQVDKEVELRQVSEQSQQQLKKDISQIMTQKTLSETMNQNLTLELGQLRDQLQSQHEAFEQTQSDLNEQICAAQREIELLKIQNIELHANNLQQDDPEETAEILRSHMEALEKGTCIEIAFGDLKEVQLMKLISEVQANWLIQQKKLDYLLEEKTEMKFKIEDLETELMDLKKSNCNEKLLNKQPEKDIEAVSFESQLKESLNLCSLKQQEITSLLQRLDIVSMELSEHKARENKLQESLQSVKIQLLTSNQKLAAAESENETVSSLNETNSAKLAYLTKQTGEELDKINDILKKIAESFQVEQEMPQQLTSDFLTSFEDNERSNLTLDESLTTGISDIYSRFRILAEKLQEYQNEQLQKYQSSQLDQFTYKKQVALLVCLQKRVREIFEKKATEFGLQTQEQLQNISKLANNVSDLQQQNDELQAQNKHLNKKLIVEKANGQELELKMKQQQAISANSIANPSDLSTKLSDATQMLEKFKQEYQELKETSQQQIAKAVEQEQNNRKELDGKYKLEMKQFLQKAVEDRKKIYAEYQEELKKLHVQIDQLKTSENSLTSDISVLNEKLTHQQSEHNREIDNLRKSEQLAGDALAKIQVELQESEANKKSVTAQYEEELRQAEEAHSDLQTKMQEEIRLQAESYERQIVELSKASEEPVLNHIAHVDERKINLSFALQSHLKNLLNAKFYQLSQDFEAQAITKLSLEQNMQQAEYKQVQQEGELRRVTEEFKKYQKDANTLMAENIKRQSDLKKTDEAKKQEIASLQEYQSNLQEQIMDYAAQIQQAEAESEKLLEHLAELQSDLNKKDQLIETLQQKQKLSPEKQTTSKDSLAQSQLLERKIQELQSLNQQQEELITQLKADNDRLKKAPEEKRNSWEFQNSGGRGSWGSNGASASQEVEEHLKHIRQIMIQFLTKLPFTTKENEDILPILFSMLNFKDGEIETVTLQRDELNKEINKEKVKDTGKNIFGFGKKKQQKN